MSTHHAIRSSPTIKRYPTRRLIFHDAGKNAFEFNLGSAVPEPSTWAMMALGFVGIGLVGWRPKAKTSALAA
jgi:PEP-CTERM motif